MKTFTIFKKSDNHTDDRWYRYVVEIDTNYNLLDANEIGEKLGAGEFVYWSSDEKYAAVHKITVAAITRYEEAQQIDETDEVLFTPDLSDDAVQPTRMYLAQSEGEPA